MKEQKQPKINDDFDETDEQKPLEVYTTQSVSNTIRVMLDENIGEPKRYRLVCSMLNNASENDLVEVHINTYGGRLDSTLQLMHALHNTKAATVAICYGVVASAGTIIALACDAIEITPYNMWMVHSPSYGLGGDFSYVKERADFSDKAFRKICHDVYTGFMTTEEIDNMIDNHQEIWMDADEVTRRLEVRAKLIEEMNNEVEKY